MEKDEVSLAQKVWIEGKKVFIRNDLIYFVHSDLFEAFLMKKYLAELKSLLTLTDPSLHYSIEIS